MTFNQRANGFELARVFRVIVITACPSLSIAIWRRRPWEIPQTTSLVIARRRQEEIDVGTKRMDLPGHMLKSIRQEQPVVVEAAAWWASELVRDNAPRELNRAVEIFGSGRLRGGLDVNDRDRHQHESLTSAADPVSSGRWKSDASARYALGQWN
jgi:hypothetical protein